MDIPEHKAIIKRLIVEAEAGLGIQAAYPYTSKLLSALSLLDNLVESERSETR